MVQFPVVLSIIFPSDPSLERFKSPVYRFAHRLVADPRSNELSTLGKILPDTSRRAAGVVVPMPMFPDEST